MKQSQSARRPGRPRIETPDPIEVRVGLAALWGRSIGSFGGVFFELSRAGEAESGMPPDGIIEPVDVAANSPVCLLAGVEDGAPDELGFQGFEERLHHGVVIAISLAGHRDQDAVLLELSLIIDRAILTAAIRMMDQPGCWTAHGQGLAQSSDSQVAMPPVACCPADNASCE